MQRLSGRTCLIAGASSGLGAHFARLACAEGAKVVLAARRLDRIEELAAQLRADGGAALATTMDVTSDSSVAAAFDAAEGEFGHVDTVVANAGISAPGRAVDVSAAIVNSVLDTNVAGVFLTVREGARRLIAGGSRESGAGRIVIIGSVAGETILPGEAIYCASKAAVKHLGRNLAREWVRLGINVNVIQPGFILTEMAADWFASDAGKAQIAAFPRRRLQPIKSLDEPFVFLCSDLSASVTGATFNIDDGHSL